MHHIQGLNAVVDDIFVVFENVLFLSSWQTQPSATPATDARVAAPIRNERASQKTRAKMLLPARYFALAKPGETAYLQVFRT